MKDPKRVFIIHGWDGDVEKNWFPSMKKSLEKRGFIVYMPKMPKPAEPNIRSWTSYLSRIVKKSDHNTFFIGHSIGCQTILRYMEKSGADCGGMIFISGWFKLKEFAYKENPEYEKAVRAIARPWINTKINFKKIKAKNTKHIVAIFSDNDYYVDLSDAKIFKSKLGAKIIIEHNKGHYAERDNIKDIPVVRKELLKMSK